MRLLTCCIALALAACANPRPAEAIVKRTISAPGLPERTCEIPAPTVPVEFQSSIQLQVQPATTVMTFEILPGGDVRSIEVKRSSGHKLLDQTAMAAVKQTKCSALPDAKDSLWVETTYTFSAGVADLRRPFQGVDSMRPAFMNDSPRR